MGRNGDVVQVESEIRENYSDFGELTREKLEDEWSEPWSKEIECVCKGLTSSFRPFWYSSKPSYEKLLL